MDLGLASLGVGGLSSALDIWKVGRASDEAQFNRDWQRDMSNTAYQRAVTDMRKAGINPMLAYMQGGASTPSGAVADVPSVSNPVTSALEIKNLSQQAEKLFEETQLTNRMDNMKRLEQMLFKESMPSLLEKAKADASSAKAVAEIQNYQIPSAKAEAEMWRKFSSEGKVGQFILPFIKSIFSGAGYLR